MKRNTCHTNSIVLLFSIYSLFVCTPLFAQDNTSGTRSLPLTAGLVFRECEQADIRANKCTTPCIFTADAERRLQDGWDRAFGPNGLVASDLYRRTLSRQVFNFDLLGGLAGGACRKWFSPIGPSKSIAEMWTYPVEGGYEGLSYYEKLLKDGKAWPPVRNIARAFTSGNFKEATAAEILYSLSNTTYPVEVHCHPTLNTMMGGARGITDRESFWAPRNHGGGQDDTAGGFIHESMHNRHFDHSCGPVIIDNRTGTNHIDATTANNGWRFQPYHGPSPTIVDSNIIGRTVPLTPLSVSSKDIHGNARPVNSSKNGLTAPYPNDFVNNALLYFPGYSEVRLYFKELSTEPLNDKVVIWGDDGKPAFSSFNPNDMVTLSGHSSGFWTNWIKAPRVGISFSSNGSIPDVPAQCSRPADCPSDQSCNRATGRCEYTHSYMGYEVLTFEGRSPNHERLTDLYRNDPNEFAITGWDSLTHAFDPHPTINIKMPNYLDPPRFSLDQVSHIWGTINTNDDKDVFPVWIPSGKEGWPQDSDYEVEFYTTGQTDIFVECIEQNYLEELLK